MEDDKLQLYEGQLVPSHPLRDLLTVTFRHRRLVILCFGGILLGAAVAALLSPTQYEARMKILVRHERVNPLVTAEPSSPVPPFAVRTTEEELNSEVELLKSRDLLEKVVVACGLHFRERRFDWARLWGAFKARRPDQAPATDSSVPWAVRALESKLRIEVIPKTDLVGITYGSHDPQLAARVLNTLANFYLEKHLAVERPPGTFEFFQQQSERYRESLSEAEARLADFNRENGVVSPQAEKTNTLQKLTEFEAMLRQTQVAIAETERRIHALEAQGTSTPRRMTTQVRTSPNSLLPQLKSTLLTLELKRTELLAKFDPSYRPVQEIEKEITQTRAAIAAAENVPLREETTDRDPAYESIRLELAKAKSELVSFQARAAALSQAVRGYRENARQLDKKEMAQQDVMRVVKTAEENYQLYLRKQEEARITDALDQKRIINVTVAEAATAPALPAQSSSSYLLVGGVLACLLSLGLAFVLDYLDSSFRTPDEVRRSLGLPVLAAIPENGGGACVSGFLRPAGTALRGDSRPALPLS